MEVTFLKEMQFTGLNYDSFENYIGQMCIGAS